LTFQKLLNYKKKTVQSKIHAQYVLDKFLGIGKKHPQCALNCIQKCPTLATCYTECRKKNHAEAEFVSCSLKCNLRCMSKCGDKDPNCAGNYFRSLHVTFKKHSKELLGGLKQERSDKLAVPLERTLFCKSNGNPFITPFVGKSFNPNLPGDLILYKSPTFRVDTRQKRWKNNNELVNVGFAVLVNQHQDRVEAITEEKVIINGKTLLLKVGDTWRMKFGGKVHRKSADTIVVSSENKNVVEYVEATFFHEKKDDHWPLPQFISITVYSSITNDIQSVVTGLCTHKKLRGKGIFQSQEYYPAAPQEPNNTANEEKKKHATEVCKNARVPKRIFDSCVTDVIQHGTSIHLSKRPKIKKTPKLPRSGPQRS